MRTTPEFNVSDAVDHRALPSVDFVDKHITNYGRYDILSVSALIGVVTLTF